MLTAQSGASLMDIATFDGMRAAPRGTAAMKRVTQILMGVC